MTQDDVEYQRVKFTLPEALAERLDDLAGEHYGGNVSQFLRSAIKDHERTLDGRDEFEFRKLRSEIQHLEDQLEQLVDSGEEAVEPSSADECTDGDTPGDKESSGAAVERRIQRCLVESDEAPLSLDRLAELVDADPLAVQTAVESLLEREYIERDADDQPVCYRVRAP